LDQQLNEKKKEREIELENNKLYIEMVISQDSKAKEEQKAKKDKLRQ
jgi:hypothetical protein